MGEMHTTRDPFSVLKEAWLTLISLQSMYLQINSGLIMCLLTDFPLASRILWRCRLYSGPEVRASADCMKGDCGEDIYAKMDTGKAGGISQGIIRGIARGIARGISPTPRTSHHLLSAACSDPEIAFANSFRGPLKTCTNRRPFKLAMQHKFLTFPRASHHNGKHLQPQAVLVEVYMMAGPA
jgi:hypothetical protein